MGSYHNEHLGFIMLVNNKNKKKSVIVLITILYKIRFYFSLEFLCCVLINNLDLIMLKCKMLSA